MEVTLRFVPHQDVDRYLRDGWMISHDLNDCYHGQFAVLMVRPCDSSDALTTTTVPARS
jgi:hypothetical protein